MQAIQTEKVEELMIKLGSLEKEFRECGLPWTADLLKVDLMPLVSREIDLIRNGLHPVTQMGESESHQEADDGEAGPNSE